MTYPIRTAVRTALLPLLVGASLAANAGEILINNVDADGVGFNDPTPAAPVGGNPGATIGDQRLFAYEFAADRWESILQPDQDIIVQASFDALPCDPDGGVLGSAGTIQVFANFEGALWPETWSHAALSNQLAGEDLSPGDPDGSLLAPPYNDDIVSFFNGGIDNNDECLAGTNWYYGVDNNAAPGDLDFLNVLMHELAHGLGFANFVDETNGQAFVGRPDVYGVFALDETTGKKLNQQNNGERESTSVNTGHLVWSGPNVTLEAETLLSNLPILVLDNPSTVFDVQEASYGLPYPGAPLAGEVVLFNDGLGDDVNDACEYVADPAVAGKIALINRGTCAFAYKSAVAQLNGAIAVIITNNQPVGLPPMGGSDLIAPSIPSIGISKDAGDLIKESIVSLPPATATLDRDPDQKAGANAEGLVKLYAPNPAEPGSSGSHFDTSATPNLLMEPFISGDLMAATDVDLTDEQMQDIGWDKQLHCPVDTDDREIVEVGGCQTGVANALGPYTTRFETESQGVGGGSMNVVGGCYLQDLVNACLAGSTTGNASSCLAGVTADLVKAGVIDQAESSAIKGCL